MWRTKNLVKGFKVGMYYLLKAEQQTTFAGDANWIGLERNQMKSNSIKMKCNQLGKLSRIYMINNQSHPVLVTGHLYSDYRKGGESSETKPKFNHLIEKVFINFFSPFCLFFPLVPSTAFSLRHLSRLDSDEQTEISIQWLNHIS